MYVQCTCTLYIAAISFYIVHRLFLTFVANRLIVIILNIFVKIKDYRLPCVYYIIYSYVKVHLYIIQFFFSIFWCFYTKGYFFRIRHVRQSMASGYAEGYAHFRYTDINQGPYHGCFSVLHFGFFDTLKFKKKIIDCLFLCFKQIVKFF